MTREFHIFASNFDTCFVVKGVGVGLPRQFTSLFAAARHARTQPDCSGGVLVIYDDENQGVNRIPFVSVETP